MAYRAAVVGGSGYTGAELLRLLAVGADKARAASEPTIEAMYSNMGFVRFSR